MSDLRSQMIRTAAGLPKGDPTRRKLLATLQGKKGSFDWYDVPEDIYRMVKVEVKRRGMREYKAAKSKLQLAQDWVDAASSDLDGMRNMERFLSTMSPDLLLKRYLISKETHKAIK